MKPHDWLFILACSSIPIALAFRVACRALDMLEGRE